MHQPDITHYNNENKMEECNIEENTTFRFNTKMETQAARGHILRTWDVLFDMDEQVLEVTLPTSHKPFAP